MHLSLPLWSLIACLFCTQVQAQPAVGTLQAPSGERLEWRTLPSAQRYLSVVLGDNASESFGMGEWVLLQLDDHPPIRLVEDLRSCAAAPRPPQSVFYSERFEPQPAQVAPPSIGQQLSTQRSTMQDLAQGLVRITVTRKPERIDWRITQDTAMQVLIEQLSTAQTLVLRYTDAVGSAHQAQFDLRPIHAELRQFLADALPL